MTMYTCAGVNLFAATEAGPPSQWAQVVFRNAGCVVQRCPPHSYTLSAEVLNEMNVARRLSFVPGNQTLRALPAGPDAPELPCARPLGTDGPRCWPASNVVMVVDSAFPGTVQAVQAAVGVRWVPGYYNARMLDTLLVCEVVADAECVRTKGISECARRAPWA